MTVRAFSAIRTHWQVPGAGLKTYPEVQEGHSDGRPHKHYKRRKGMILQNVNLIYPLSVLTFSAKSKVVLKIKPGSCRRPSSFHWRCTPSLSPGHCRRTCTGCGQNAGAECKCGSPCPRGSRRCRPSAPPRRPTHIPRAPPRTGCGLASGGRPPTSGGSGTGCTT